MTRTAFIGFALLLATSVFAQDRAVPKAHPMFIATTGRVVAIDPAARTLTVTSSGDPAFLELKSTSRVLSSLQQFTVFTTSETLFQDGADPIRFEDFKVGDTISVHGHLSRSILRASRVAKWN